MAKDSEAKDLAKRAYHHGDLREALVAAASRLLETEGAAALSLRRVAREAEVSHTAPYRHFKDKHELLEAVAASGFRALERRLSQVQAELPDDPRRQMIEACRIYVAETVAHRERAHLMFGGLLDPSRRSPELTTAIEESFSRLVATVRRGEEALYRRLPTRELVLTLWSATHGLALLAAADQIGDLAPSDDPEALIELVVTRVFEGLVEKDSND